MTLTLSHRRRRRRRALESQTLVSIIQITAGEEKKISIHTANKKGKDVQKHLLIFSAASFIYMDMCWPILESSKKTKKKECPSCAEDY